MIAAETLDQDPELVAQWKANQANLKGPIEVGDSGQLKEWYEETTIDNPFSDVEESEFYYKAILWAVEQGITNGVAKTTFNPDGNCTRGQIVSFLYRYMAE